MNEEPSRPRTSANAQTDVKPTTSSWSAVASVAIGTFVLVTSEFLPIGLLSKIAADVHVTDGRAGLLVTVPGIVAAVAAPLATVAAGNIDRKFMLVGLTCLVILSNSVVAIGSSFTLMLLGRVFLGAAVGGFWAFAAAVGRRLVHADQGARATTLIMTGVSVGTVLGVPIGSVIGQMAGWRTAFAGVTILAVAVLAGQLLLLPHLPSRRAGGFSSLLAIVRIPRASIGLGAAALLAAGHFVAYTYLEPFLSEVSHMSSGELSLTLAGYGLAGIAGTILAERALAWNAAVAFTGVSLLLGVAIGLTALVGADPRLTAVAVVIWGAAFGAVPLSVQIWTYQAAPEQFEAGSALLVTVFQIALASGALLGGRVVDGADIQSAFWMGAVLSLGCAAFLGAAFVIRRPGAARPA